VAGRILMVHETASGRARLLVIVLAIVACAELGLAIELNVTVFDDPTPGPCDSHCSLREAILAANALGGADTINLPAGLYGMDIPGYGEDIGYTGDYDILDSVTIRGAGAGLTVIDAESRDRVFHVDVVGGTVIFEGLTITGGQNWDGPGGGGVYIKSAVNVQIVECEITDNDGSTGLGRGGGVLSTWTLFLGVSQSTISDNFAVYGGGIYVLNTDNFTLSQSAVGHNRTGNGGSGGGLFIGESGYAHIVNSTFAFNSADGDADMQLVTTEVHIHSITASGYQETDSLGVWGAEVELKNSLIHGSCYVFGGTGLVSGGGNLESPGNTCYLDPASDYLNVLDPGLGHVDDYTKATEFFPLEATSLALDSVRAEANCLTQDQHGGHRPRDGDGDRVALCDIGAVEMPEPPFFFDDFETGTTGAWSVVVP
jgi:CSLREA domain-containing protein